jgi:hypothetical protein
MLRNFARNKINLILQTTTYTVCRIACVSTGGFPNFPKNNQQESKYTKNYCYIFRGVTIGGVWISG